MGKKQRDKGIRGELKAVSDLQSIFPECARNLSETRDGNTGIDLINTGNLDVQVKFWSNKYAPATLIKETPRRDGRYPLLVLYANHKPGLAVMYLDDLIKILGDVGEAYE